MTWRRSCICEVTQPTLTNLASIARHETSLPIICGSSIVRACIRNLDWVSIKACVGHTITTSKRNYLPQSTEYHFPHGKFSKYDDSSTF